jgi:CDP-4-dehydro-6-deoxyglucose reductase, E1
VPTLVLDRQPIFSDNRGNVFSASGELMSLPEKLDFPLVDSSYDNQEIITCIATLLSGQLTMSGRVRAFEEAFSKHCGAPFGVMVNSGSSANLLAMSALTNPLRREHLRPGDKVAVPAVCWSTSLWPIIQMGLIPVLVDVDPQTLNLSIPSLKKALVLHDVKAVMMVHILGNSTEMGALLEIVRNHKLFLIEDTCESLGSTYDGKTLGTLGDFGTFSFYFSHHMTTIEGGMVLAKTEEDYDLLKCLRAHGWSREQSNRAELEHENSHIDPRFLFVNLGYNVRPMEVQAAFGLEQLKRLDEMNAHRRNNVTKIRSAFTRHPKWKDQLRFPMATQNLDACWFGFPFLIDPAINFNYKKFTAMLLERGVDTRPIVSGNMALQPAVKHFNVDLSMGPFEGAQQIHDRGLFFGCHAKPVADATVERLADLLLECLQQSSH